MSSMTVLSVMRSASAMRDVAALSGFGRTATLYALVLVFAWIGAMKFTAYEAAAIDGLIASSPLLSWLHVILDQRGVANLIGTVEIAAAALLALRPWSTIASLVGAMLVAATTLVTLSFLFTAPGWEQSLGGFPALSVVPGQFLVKDAVLLGAALWLAGDTLQHRRRAPSEPATAHSIGAHRT
ncbi:MAG: DUF417 family protein [Alphaproteobacteria bacterium]